MTKAFSPKDVFAMMVNSSPEIKAQWYIEQINTMIATENYTHSNMAIDMGAIQTPGARNATVLLVVQFTANDVKRMSEVLYKAIAIKLREGGWTDVTIDLVESKITCKAVTDLIGLSLTDIASSPVSKDAKSRMAALAEASMGASETEEIGNAITRLGSASAESNKLKVNSGQPFSRGAGINPLYHSKSV